MRSGVKPTLSRSVTTGTVAARNSSAISPVTRLKAIGQCPLPTSAQHTSRTHSSDPARRDNVLLVKRMERRRAWSESTWLVKSVDGECLSADCKKRGEHRPDVLAVAQHRTISPIQNALASDPLV